jgi:UDP-N-acetylmuramate dehydrogenase
MSNKILLSNVTTYRFGGECNSFYVLNSVNQIKEIFKDTIQNDIFILGKGSNVAFSDEGYKGTIIKNEIEFIEILDDKKTINVGAGSFLPDVSRFLYKHGLSGGEFLLGIPGTVGGAIKMNAGSYGYEIGNFVESITCFDLDLGKIIEIESKNLNFHYRKTQNLENYIILSAKLIFNAADPKIIKDKMSEMNKLRKKSQPSAIYNAGSVFKNPKGYYAAELIDKAGLKGFEIDGVSVSNKHANFFVAKKGASAKSLYNLVQHVKDTVNIKYGVTLEEEIIFIGNF